MDTEFENLDKLEDQREKFLEVGSRLGVLGGFSNYKELLVFEVEKVTKKIAFIKAVNSEFPSGLYKVKRGLKLDKERFRATWYGKVPYCINPLEELYYFDKICERIEEAQRTTYALKLGLETLEDKIKTMSNTDGVVRSKAVYLMTELIDELGLRSEKVHELLQRKWGNLPID
jgi:hypothetical protein